MAQVIRVNRKLKVELGEPIPVAAARPSEKRWGFYQFPAMSKLPDGRILYEFSNQNDAVEAYGGTPGLYVSDDEGRTWKPFRDKSPDLVAPHPVVSEVGKGEFLCVFPEPAFDPKRNGVKLPEPAGEFQTYGSIYLYRFKDLPKKLRNWLANLPALRWTPKTREWKRESVRYDTRGALAWSRGGSDSGLVPRTWIERRLLRVGGELLYADYRRPFESNDGGLAINRTTALMVSRDNGRSFKRRSVIADPTGRDMMAEPMLALNVRGELVCAIRRAHHKNYKPMLIVHSKDMGRTWGKPQSLFGFGVWPTIETLDCGVMVLTYGRPGVFMSFSPDGLGHEWTKPIPIIPGKRGEPVGAKTCAYTCILKLNEREFLLAYSDFLRPGKDGRPRKTLMVRRIAVQ